MNTDLSKTTSTKKSPKNKEGVLRLIIALVASIFIVETLVMFVLPLMPELPLLAEAIIDSSLLILMVLPAIYFFSFRPMSRSFKEILKAKETAETTTIAKSDFLASMSHEIRTPMTAMLGMIEYLSDSSLNDDQKDALRVLRGASENLLALTNDVLDLAKIEAGQLKLEKAEFDLEGLLSEIESFMGVAARGKGLELSYHIEPVVPVKLIGDSKHLRQIIFNLVSNAVKFTKKGRIDINVSKKGAKGDTIRTGVLYQGYRDRYS